MGDVKNSNGLAEERTDMAQERTDWAEDRTLMANERTFAGWMRTGLAAVGIGLGFNALFGKLEPYWAPRGIATIFIVIGIFIFWAAQRRGCDVQERMSAHSVKPIKRANLRLIAGAMAFGSLCLAVGMWTIKLPE